MVGFYVGTDYILRCLQLFSARFVHTAPCTSNPPAPRATVLLVLLGGVCPELVSGVLALGAQGTICVRWVKY